MWRYASSQNISNACKGGGASHIARSAAAAIACKKRFSRRRDGAYFVYDIKSISILPLLQSAVNDFAPPSLLVGRLQFPFLLLQEMEKSRFDRMFRQYLQDLMLMIKSEMRDVNPNEFYTLFRYDLNQTLDALKDVMGYYDNAIRTNSFTQLVPDDIKRAQNK